MRRSILRHIYRISAWPYAYKELLNTDHTISSIALDNGFASSRAFSREFVKRYGILPGRVERQNHKNVKKVL